MTRIFENDKYKSLNHPKEPKKINQIIKTP